MGGGGQMNFYGDLPDSYNLVVNTNHALVKDVLNEKNDKINSKLEGIVSDLNSTKSEKESLEKLKEGKKEEDISQEEKDKLTEVEGKLTELNSKKESILSDFGKGNNLVKQLIDLALLANNMLKGEALNKFVKRSVELIEK